jgi:hypothetical protein
LREALAGSAARSARDCRSAGRSASVSAPLRWWSTLEASWINWTLFDRASRDLGLDGVEALTTESQVVREAAGLLGLATEGG